MANIFVALYVKSSLLFKNVKAKGFSLEITLESVTKEKESIITQPNQI